MQANNAISIVIPNWNGAALLAKNLPAVLTAAGPETEVIVVDDGSRDNSREVVRELAGRFENLKLIVQKKNSGFSSAVNAGVSKARGEIVVLLNTDVRPENNFLQYLPADFGDDRIFAVGFLDRSYEKGRIVERGRAVGRFARGFLMHNLGEIKPGVSLWANGGSGAFHRRKWQDLGGLDTILDPFYGEDLDLGYRAWKSGYRIIFDPRIVVGHFHEEGPIRGHFSPFYRRAVAFRNQNIIVWKDITDPGYIFNYFYWLPFHLLRAILRGDGAMVYGLILAIFKIPQAFRRRLQTGKKFILSDREVGKYFAFARPLKNEELF